MTFARFFLYSRRGKNVHSINIYINIYMLVHISLPSFKGNIAFIFNIHYMFSETNLINVHRCNLFLVFHILT